MNTSEPQQPIATTIRSAERERKEIRQVSKSSLHYVFLCEPIAFVADETESDNTQKGHENEGLVLESRTVKSVSQNQKDLLHQAEVVGAAKIIQYL